MSRPIVIITNTAPFSGEVFLCRELEWVPEPKDVLLFPILAKNTELNGKLLRQHIRVEACASTPGFLDKLHGVLRGSAAPLLRNEIPAILKAPHPLWNWIKAVKFAALSESRVHAIRRLLRRQYPGQSFLFYSYWFYEAGYVAARLKECFPGSSFVSRCHGYDLYQERHPNGYLPYRSALLKCADRVFPVSENGLAYLQDRCPREYRHKLQLMRLGTRDHGCCTASPTEPLTLLSCSNLVDVKRVDRIISALSLLRQPVQWYHFGDGPLMAQLQQQARSLPETVQWQFFGNRDNEWLMDFYRTHYADGFLNVSASEGVPVSIMEAMSFGIPIVATDVGGTGELVRHNENGFLLRKDFHPEELAEAISRLRPDRDRLGRASRSRWEKMCSAGNNYAEFYAALESL